ncbi:hypothetical protein VP01_1796g4 [Puccinia sorghi]|uniref:Uncharacterized protein n=1 Tax=Puccinia sorghi TaxID=27349 RepID=A0A0L6VEF3_9BASI|nr:hypothetical protein VP01_1796g4 [Puccinia sorghi]
MTKHLDIKARWLRDLNKKNEIVVQLIPSEYMVADSLTKASSSESLQRLQERFFLFHFSSSSGGYQLLKTIPHLNNPTYFHFSIISLFLILFCYSLKTNLSPILILNYQTPLNFHFSQKIILFISSLLFFLSSFILSCLSLIFFLLFKGVVFFSTWLSLYFLLLLLFSDFFHPSVLVLVLEIYSGFFNYWIFAPQKKTIMSYLVNCFTKFYLIQNDGPICKIQNVMMKSRKIREKGLFHALCVTRIDKFMLASPQCEFCLHYFLSQLASPFLTMKSRQTPKSSRQFAKQNHRTRTTPRYWTHSNPLPQDA